MEPLDNPLWSSLTTLHRPLARGTSEVLRYPAEVAPFVAVARAGTGSGMTEIVEPGETVFLVGPRPAVPRGWRLEELGVILQMVCGAPPAVPPGPPIVLLDDPAAVGELAALVYPHYFRPRTTDLGRYFGIYGGTTLAAMAGERMGMPGYREISAVCTHPDYAGRGLARRLLAYLSDDIARRGDTPFLHVSPGNTRAVALYEHNGYCTRVPMPFAALTR